MSVEFLQDMFILILVALTGGLIAKMVKLHSLLGFIIAGVVLKLVFPHNSFGVERVAQLGLIFLLFTIGLELSFERLTKVLKVAVVGACIQIILVTLVCYFALKLAGIDNQTSLILSMGFSLSSTAVVVKLMADRDEVETIHGGVMIGWLLIQDLVVIPMLILIDFMSQKSEAALPLLGISMVKAFSAICLILIIGRLIAPKVLHWVASFNSRELLLLTSVFLALGTALVTSLLGVSSALGAFLAGVVISSSMEKHAIFAEIRPLRDLFVGIFFVSLGLFITPSFILPNLWIIICLTLLVIVIKVCANFFVSIFLGYHGKTAILVSLGLSQIGEFSFIIFSLSKSLSLISDRAMTIGISCALLSLVVFPALYRFSTPLWRRLRKVTARFPALGKFLVGWDRVTISEKEDLKDHIIICGYGRVGGWVGRALESLSIPFMVVDYDQSVVSKLKKSGANVIYGDPTEREVLEAAGIGSAKALVVAIPDKNAQEGIITLTQTIAPKVKIISRVHSDDDWAKLKVMKVDKVIQPEFEAAVAIVRSILSSMGKTPEEVTVKIKSLRQSRTLST